MVTPRLWMWTTSGSQQILGAAVGPPGMAMLVQFTPWLVEYSKWVLPPAKTWLPFAAAAGSARSLADVALVLRRLIRKSLLGSVV